ncbi:MAG TPA: TrmB family transcriptional regulator [Bacillota bacterium]|nr:TrmB family transcriptional regulator [Bacillota bacterium]
MELVESLMKVGLTRQESIFYLTLCKEGELTGYEAAKSAGISRSNAYQALSGLVDKGGAYRIEGDPVKFIAVPIREFTGNIRRRMGEVLEYLEKNVPHREEPSEPFITIAGTTHIINKMKQIIEQATERIYFSGAEAELDFVMSDFQSAVARGLKVVVITTPPFQKEGMTVFHHRKSPGQIRLIADSTHVLTGEISESGESTCLYSKNKNLIALIKDSLTNEIQLIQLHQDGV